MTRVRLSLALAALLLGVAATACDKFGSRDSSLGRFAKGELAKLEVKADAPKQPDIMFIDEHGGRHTLAEFRGKVLVVNLWATWCAPCVKEMPSLDRLAADRASDKVAVVAISFDRGVEDARKFYDEKGVKSLALYLDSSTAMAHLLGVDGIPITVIYDPEGRELARLAGGGGANWDSPEAHALIDAAVKRAFPAKGGA
jgi:thiol-disulfide isomerase/thioredoxin